MTNSRPSPTAPRPDPEKALLEAIEQRDAFLSRKLVLQWVHRRGLASFQEFQGATLAPIAGSQACRWLEAMLEGPFAATPPPRRPDVLLPPAEEVGPPIRVHDFIDVDGVIDSPAEELDPESLAEVEAAFAALAAEFASAVQAPADPVPAPADPMPAPVDPMPAVAPPSPVAEALSRACLEDAPRSLVAVEPKLVPDLAPELAPDQKEMPARRLPMPPLGRLKSLVRGCCAGALTSLQAVRARGAERRQPCDAGDAVDTVDAVDPGEADGFVGPAELTDAPADPVAPLPAFHGPLIAGLEDLPAPQSAAAGDADPDSAAHPNVSGVRQAMGELPFRLPRFRSVGPSQRPAPAPDAIADLRAWLPDDDLPRAC